MANGTGMAEFDLGNGSERADLAGLVTRLGLKVIGKKAGGGIGGDGRTRPGRLNGAGDRWADFPQCPRGDR